MGDIFLSYKSEDRARAKIIADALEKQGYSVWWDRVIPPGKTFDQVIEEKLKEAKCIIVLWSKESVLSEWVKIEASIGAKRRILIPILIDNVEIPLEFCRIQAAQLIDWDGTLPNPAFDILLDSVKEIIGRPKTTTIEAIKHPENILKRKEDNKKNIDQKIISALRFHEDHKYMDSINEWNEILKLDPENKIAIEGIVNAKLHEEEERHQGEMKALEKHLDKNRLIIYSLIAVIVTVLLLFFFQSMPAPEYLPKSVPIINETPILPEIRPLPYDIRGTPWNETSDSESIGGRGNTANWNVSNFAGFYYDLQEDLGKESLQLLQTNLEAGQRKIDKNNLVYSTTVQPRQLEIVKKFNNNVSAATLAGLTGKAFADGRYYVIGWNLDQYVAIKGNNEKLSRLIINQGNAGDENKTLAVGESWDIGEGWTLEARSIDSRAPKRQAWLVLRKDGFEKDNKVLFEGNVYTYVEKSIAGEIDIPMFVTYADSIFSGPTSDMIKLRYTWAISPNVMTIKNGDKLGVFTVVTTIGNSLVLKNSDSTLSLTRDSTVNLMGNLTFKVADEEFLRFMPMKVIKQPGVYEMRGAIWNEKPIIGSVGGNGKMATWNANNFAGFYYDIQENVGKESLQVLQKNLGAGQRIIDKDKLVYTTTARPGQLKVMEKFNNDVTSAASAGLAQTGTGQAFADGNYYIVGWNLDRYVAINGRIDKLSRLIFDQGKASSDKKTLAVGESWDIGDSWTLTINSLDARASPRKAWLMLSKNGVEKDRKVINEKNIYTYVEKNISGEIDIPMFVTYADSIFSGATSDMIQLRYTWAISPNVTTIQSGDKYGIFNVVYQDMNLKNMVLRNTDSTINLPQGSKVDLMGDLGFKVADRADILRFMPVIEVEFR